jgi:3-oxoacyl-[acyl-carrier protein] reductase
VGDKRVVLVTGASRGIGKQIAIELGQAGDIVVGTATTEKGAASISDYLAANNIEGKGLVLDVCNEDSIKQCLDDAVTSFGAIQVLVNNAGITRDNLLMRMKLSEWQEVYNTNIQSIFLLSKACLRAMMKAKNGRIINISSVVAATGNPGQANYASAKAAIDGFTKSLAKEVASRGITVNSVAPGFISTDMTDELDDKQREQIIQSIPVARFGHTEDIAKAVKFLASDDASYITGQTLHVNGGMHMA